MHSFNDNDLSIWANGRSRSWRTCAGTERPLCHIARRSHIELDFLYTCRVLKDHPFAVGIGLKNRGALRRFPCRRIMRRNTPDKIDYFFIR